MQKNGPTTGRDYGRTVPGRRGSDRRRDKVVGLGCPRSTVVYHGGGVDVDRKTVPVTVETCRKDGEI